MTRLQQWLAGTAAVVVAIVAAGWFLAIAPQKHKASNVVAQATAQDQTNAGLKTKLSVLTAQLQSVPTEAALVAAVGQRIPDDPALPDYVRTLTATAKLAGVELVAIAPGTPTSVALPAAAAAPTPSASPSGSAHAAVAAPVAPAADLQAITLSLSVQGGYFQIQQFTAALEKLDRSTIVTAISLAPGSSLKQASGAPVPTSAAWKALTSTITVTIFMNSSAAFTAVPTPSTSTASVPGAAVASAAALPSASASN